MTLQLLGRDGELAHLQQELAGLLQEGESRLVLVRGEPGIGKSALLRAFIDSAPQLVAGRSVLVGYGQSMTNSLDRTRSRRSASACAAWCRWPSGPPHAKRSPGRPTPSG